MTGRPLSDAALPALCRWPVTPASRDTVRVAVARWRPAEAPAVADALAHLGVQPLATAVLRAAAWDLVSEPLRALLEAAARQAAAYAARALADCQAVLARLDAAGIRAAVFKGPVLAQQLFGHHLRRPGGDIDLLVPAATIDAATAVIQAGGYVVRAPTNAPGLRAGQHAVTLDPAGGAVAPEIDLHWAFTEAWVSRLPDDWAHYTEWVAIGERRFPALSGPLAALQAALHLAAHGYLFRHAVDLAGWDRRLSDAERAVLRALAVEAGAEGHVLRGLELVRELWGPPHAGAAAPLPGAGAVAYARGALLAALGVGPAAVLHETPLRRPYVRVLVRALGADDRRRALLGAARQALLPGRPYLEWRYGSGGLRTWIGRPWRALTRLLGDLGRR